MLYILYHFFAELDGDEEEGGRPTHQAGNSQVDGVDNWTSCKLMHA